MDKNVYVLLLLTAATFGISAVKAEDGTVKFNGNITDEACSVDVKSVNQSISMGTVSTSAFKSAGEVAAPTRFSIVLNNCPASVSSVNASFTGTADQTNTDLLGLSSDSGATGVGVAIYESDSKTLIPLRSDSEDLVIKTEAGVNTLNYVAKYMATASTVTPGTANAAADFTLGYK
ncbi:fimbrial protein [Pantoea agglomerans]|uniref:fimbrial protein n=1 Tax=Enterobacter agglomerans TaxID=549 RepID=UPI003DA05409